MFEIVDGRTTDAGVTGILIAHLVAFGSGELKKTNIKTSKCFILKTYMRVLKAYNHNYINIERDTHVLTYIK